MEDQLTIIVPVYNEAENINRLESELNAYLDSAVITSKVLFVDDGSIDDSLNLIKNICSRNLKYQYLAFRENRGLSAALKAGFDFTETSLLGYMDSDLQTSPMDFNVLIKHIKENDLVTGVRTNRKDSFVKMVSSRLANSIRRLFTNDGMDDTGCPLKIIRTDVAKRIPMFQGLHRFLPAMVLLQKGKIKQVPVRHFPRIAGKAKFGLRNRLLGPLLDCFAYLWMKKNYITYHVSEKSK